jgi:glutamine amidotransferase
MITIIDIGMGNLGSIVNMLEKIKVKAVISSDENDIFKAEKLILPGVGSFDNAMKNLNDMHLISILNSRVNEDKIPILGICLGIQLFTKRSEEGVLPGLGWIDATTVKFNFSVENVQLKVPHMGWNTVNPKHDSSLFCGLLNESRFYFVHSYHIICNNTQDILSTTHYGYDFVSSIQSGNIYGTQFHPEKSHKFGMKVLQNFAETG